jgi:hypothetical protein
MSEPMHESSSGFLPAHMRDEDQEEFLLLSVFLFRCHLWWIFVRFKFVFYTRTLVFVCITGHANLKYIIENVRARLLDMCIHGKQTSHGWKAGGLMCGAPAPVHACTDVPMRTTWAGHAMRTCIRLLFCQHRLCWAYKGKWPVTFYRPSLWCKRTADTLPPGSVCLRPQDVFSQIRKRFTHHCN